MILNYLMLVPLPALLNLLLLWAIFQGLDKTPETEFNESRTLAFLGLLNLVMFVLNLGLFIFIVPVVITA